MDSTLVNFRDIGGYKTEQGTTVKKDIIFRAGQPVGLSADAKKAFVEQYHLKTIVDFRTDKECEEMPDDAIAGINNIHIDIFENESGASTDLSSLEAHSLDADESMLQAYERIVTSKQAQKNYRKFLLLLNDLSSTPLMFHCFAGKDRTGFGAYLILKLLGVAESDIMHDYLLTNDARKNANEEIIEIERKNGMAEEELNGLRTSLGVKKEYLEYAKKIIDTQYGGFNSYVSNQLDLDDDFIVSFRNNFTK